MENYIEPNYHASGYLEGDGERKAAICKVYISESSTKSEGEVLDEVEHIITEGGYDFAEVTDLRSGEVFVMDANFDCYAVSRVLFGDNYAEYEDLYLSGGGPQ